MGNILDFSIKLLENFDYKSISTLKLNHNQLLEQKKFIELVLGRSEAYQKTNIWYENMYD